MSEDSSTVLDQKVLEQLQQLDPGGVNRLLPRVLTTYQSSLARLRQQLVHHRTAGDVSGIRLCVHTLKSSSASVGALQLSALCAEAEQCVRDGQLQTLPLMLQSLEAEADRVDAAVRQLLQAPR